MADRPTLSSGSRLASRVCTTEVIVVRPPAGDIELTCGGQSMIPLSDAPRPSDVGLPEAGLNTGTQLGKRYTAAGDDSFEVLVTKGGAGTLANGRTPLAPKTAKALPSSD